MKGSGYCIFYVAQQGIHPFEGWVFNPFTPTFGDERNRMASGLFHCFETSQAIADHNASNLQTGLCIAFDFSTAKPADCPQLHPLRAMFFPFRFNDGNKRSLMCSATPRLSWTLTTDICIIYLNTATELFSFLTLQHHLHQLVLHLPCRVIADANIPLQLQR